jgi:hypothetical protein
VSAVNIHLICLIFIRFELVKHHTRLESRTACGTDQAIDQARLQTSHHLPWPKTASKVAVVAGSRPGSVVRTLRRRSLPLPHLSPPAGLPDQNSRRSSCAPPDASFEAMRARLCRRSCQLGRNAPLWCPDVWCPPARQARHRRKLRSARAWCGRIPARAAPNPSHRLQRRGSALPLESDYGRQQRTASGYSNGSGASSRKEQSRCAAGASRPIPYRGTANAASDAWNTAPSHWALQARLQCQPDWHVEADGEVSRSGRV